MNAKATGNPSLRVTRGAFRPRGVRWRPFVVENTGSTNRLWLGNGPCGDWLLKWYRYPKAGTHPESEISEFLRDQNFQGVAEFGGRLDSQSDEGWTTVAFVQRWLEGRSMWARTVEVMRSGSRHLGLGRELGRSVGRLHQALGSGAVDSSFTKEPWTSSSQKAWLGRISGCLERLRDACLHSISSDSGNAAARDSIQLCLSSMDQWRDRIQRLSTLKVTGEMSRVHGDLHLGQVLERKEARHKEQFAFVDFEGEPMRSIAERRRKDLPLRDVAGMFRSFAYAAAVAEVPVQIAEQWSAEFLEGWREHMSLPAGEWEGLLEGLVWEKALYEAEYELAHRPDWLWIPLSVLSGA